MAKLTGKKQVVLDIGCADMPNPYLRANNLIGLDLERKELTPNYTSFHQGDLASFIAQQNIQVDAIVAGEILEHLDQPLSFLQECYKALEHGGALILSTPNPHSPIESFLNIFLNKKFFYTQDHLILFPQRWLIRIVERAGFTNIKLYSGGFPVPYFGLVPFPRPWCHQTILTAQK